MRYDGDDHYDVISAFIKSMRGSDPDAAIHYLARMLKADGVRASSPVASSGLPPADRRDAPRNFRYRGRGAGRGAGREAYFWPKPRLPWAAAL